MNCGRFFKNADNPVIKAVISALFVLMVAALAAAYFALPEKTAACAATGAEADSVIIAGVGEENKTSVFVSDSVTVTLNFSFVPSNQYYLAFKAEENGGYLPISVLMDGYFLYPVYNTYSNAFLVPVNVREGSAAVLEGYSSEGISAEVYLCGLFVGESTQNAVYGLSVGNGDKPEIAVADLENGPYDVRLQLYGNAESGTKFYITPYGGNSAAMYFDAEFDCYAAEIAVTDAVRSFIISGTGGESVLADVFLVPSVKVNTPLPVTSPETFVQYEMRCFVYRTSEEGYYTLSYVADPANAEFSLAYKYRAGSSAGTSIPGGDYPIYIEAAVNYYFDVTYTGIAGGSFENMPRTVEAVFIVSEWKDPTIELYQNVYVPVTSSRDAKTAPVNIEGDDGTQYSLVFYEVPVGAERIFVLYAGKTQILDTGTDFACTITVESGYGQILFTSDYGEFVSCVFLSYVPADYDDELSTDKLTAITLRRRETLGYYLYGLLPGEYKITLVNCNGNVSVSDGGGNTLIGRGSTSGVFTVKPEESSFTAVLYFANEGNTKVSFNALVMVTPVKTIETGKEVSLTLQSGGESNFELNQGINIYTISLTFGEDALIAVYLDGGQLLAAGADYGEFFLTTEGSHIITFKNVSSRQASFTATISYYQ